MLLNFFFVAKKKIVVGEEKKLHQNFKVIHFCVSLDWRRVLADPTLVIHE